MKFYLAEVKLINRKIMLAKYNSSCFFCDRQIIAGKHTISRGGKKWLHSACVEAMKDGIQPIPSEDLGKDYSCGICYGCQKLRDCVDAHSINEPKPLEEDNVVQSDSEECRGCINHLDDNLVHLCTKTSVHQQHHHRQGLSAGDEEYCHGCESGVDADSAHTCGRQHRSMIWRWTQDAQIGC